MRSPISVPATYRQSADVADIVCVGSLLAFAVFPAPGRLAIAALWCLWCFLKPHYYFVSFLVMVYLDSLIVVPSLGRSLTFLLAPAAVAGAVAQHVRRPVRPVLFHREQLGRPLLLWLVLFSISTIVATVTSYAKGRIDVEWYSLSFVDPSRGLVLLLIIVSAAIVIVLLGEQPVSAFFVSRLWICVVTGIASTLLAYFGNVSSEERLVGTLGDPNYAARAFVVSIAISALIFKQPVLKYTLVLLFAAALMSTSSRAGCVALVALCGAHAVARLQRHSSARRMMAIYSFAAVLLCSAVLVVLAMPSLTRAHIFLRFTDPEPLRLGVVDMSSSLDLLTSGRTFIWRTALGEWWAEGWKAVLLGIGTGRSPFLCQGEIGRTIAVHSAFLDLLLEAGLLGLVAFLGVLWSMLHDKKIRIRPDGLSVLILVGYVCTSAALSGFWTKHTFLFLFAFYATALYEGRAGWAPRVRPLRHTRGRGDGPGRPEIGISRERLLQPVHTRASGES